MARTRAHRGAWGTAAWAWAARAGAGGGCLPCVGPTVGTADSRLAGLLRIPCFRHLVARDAGRLLHAARLVELVPGEQLPQNRGTYAVLEGTVDVFDAERAKLISTRTAGQLFRVAATLRTDDGIAPDDRVDGQGAASSYVFAAQLARTSDSAHSHRSLLGRHRGEGKTLVAFVADTDMRIIRAAAVDEAFQTTLDALLQDPGRHLMHHAPFFRKLSPAQHSLLVCQSVYESHDEDTTLIREGEWGDTFHMLLCGHLRVHKGRTGDGDAKPREATKSTLMRMVENPLGIAKGKPGAANGADDDGTLIHEACDPGFFFGEAALLFGMPRTATVETVTKSLLIRLNKSSMVDVMEQLKFAKAMLEREVSRRMVTMLGKTDVPYLNGLDGAQLEQFIDICTIVEADEGELIFKQGERGENDAMFIVLHGTLSAHRLDPEDNFTPAELDVLANDCDQDESGNFMGDPSQALAWIVQSRLARYNMDASTCGSLVKELNVGDYFGELALMLDCPRAATVSACSKSLLLKIERSKFQDFMLRAPPEFVRDLQKRAVDRVREWKETVDAMVENEVHQEARQEEAAAKSANQGKALPVPESKGRKSVGRQDRKRFITLPSLDEDNEYADKTERTSASSRVTPLFGKRLSSAISKINPRLSRHLV